MKIGLQLYSVGDKLNNDFEGTLKAIADMLKLPVIMEELPRK